MAAAGVSSPSSSPRLPSPPPFTEVQIAPKSPSVGESFGKDTEQLPGEDDGSARRIRPGTRAADMAFGPPLIPLNQLDSPFQLQEHLKALYHTYTKPEGSGTVVPITREVAIQLAEPPEGVDRSLWLYELCRFLTMKVNNLIIAFFAEDPPCSSQTCPEMRASEWQYLCAVHDPPKSCCAIDYCCHTLDWATNILTSPKYFPSRLTLGSEAGGGPQASMRHLTNIFRRLYRIFAHAWFQHRDVFWQVEGHEGLYIFFKTVCDMYGLIPEDNYTVPAEAEGPEAHRQASPESADGRRLTILRKEDEGSFHGALEDMEASAISTGATTRRHKHTPSMGSRVTTIAESAEDHEDRPRLPEVQEDSVLGQPEPAAELLSEPDTPVEAPKTVDDDASSEVTVEVHEEKEPEAEELATPVESTETPATSEHSQVQEPKAEESKPEESKPEESTETTQEGNEPGSDTPVSATHDSQETSAPEGSGPGADTTPDSEAKDKQES